MSKELDTVELNNVIVEIAQDDISTLDDLSLALIGGGEMTVNP